MNLFTLGNFILSSGRRSDWKIDCDALTDEDIEALARMIREIVNPFSSVEGIPRGGLRLAKALEQYATHESDIPTHLIVDDVLTTGNSLREAKILFQQYNPSSPVVGAVIFARGPCPPWVSVLFQIAPKLWED